IRTTALHADRTQQDRLRAVEGFRSGTYRVLVATDIAARGLDIDGIEQVINYEVPFNRETYVHRVGRTGRAASTGVAITLVAPEERQAMDDIAQAFGLVLFEDGHAELDGDGKAEGRQRRGRASGRAAAAAEAPANTGELADAADPGETPEASGSAGEDGDARSAARKRRRRRRRPSGARQDQEGAPAGAAADAVGADDGRET